MYRQFWKSSILNKKYFATFYVLNGNLNVVHSMNLILGTYGCTDCPELLRYCREHVAAQIPTVSCSVKELYVQSLY